MIKQVWAAPAILAASAFATHAVASEGITPECSPSTGWYKNMENFRAQPLEKQLNKLKFKDGSLTTRKLPRNVKSGLNIVQIGNFLEYRQTDGGFEYRFVVDELMRDRASVNYHYAYTVELFVDGEFVELEQAGREPAYPICSATDGSCTTEMVSFWSLSPDLFDRIEAMPDNQAIKVRVKENGREYFPCKTFISTGHFKVLRAAIDRLKVS